MAWCRQVPSHCLSQCWRSFITSLIHYNDVIMSSMASQITSLAIVYTSVYSGTDQRKHQSSVSLAFVWGIHRWPVNSPHKWPVTRNFFHLMASSCHNEWMKNTIVVSGNHVPNFGVYWKCHFFGFIFYSHDDVIKWKHFPRYWPFVRGIHRSLVNSPHKGQWRGALVFSLICVWINGWVNNREAGDLRRRRAHYDVTVMFCAAGCISPFLLVLQVRLYFQCQVLCSRIHFDLMCCLFFALTRIYHVQTVCTKIYSYINCSCMFSNNTSAWNFLGWFVVCDLTWAKKYHSDQSINPSMVGLL